MLRILSHIATAFLLDPLAKGAAAGESDVAHLDFSISVGSLDQANTSLSAHHTHAPSQGADFRESLKLEPSDIALAVSFTVAATADSFQVGELSGLVRNLLSLGLQQEDIRVSAKVDTEASGERIYRLVFSAQDMPGLATELSKLQLGEGYLGDLSFSHRFGDEVHEANQLKAALNVKTEISRAYLKGMAMSCNYPPSFSALGLALSDVKFGLGFDNLSGFFKGFPNPDFNMETVNCLSKEINIAVASLVKAEGVPPPIKETFFAFQEYLKGLHEVSLYVGDHILSVKCTGFEFDRLLLPKEELLKIDTDPSQVRLLNLVQGMSFMPQPPETRLLMLGLDASGKTTMLYKLKLGDVVSTIPTIGFNVEIIKYKGKSLTFWDVGGQDRIRPLWRHYLNETKVLLYVVDCTDRERLTEANEELSKLLRENDLINAHLIVLANKQDLPRAMSTQELAEKLNLHSITDRQWTIQATCASTGEGLYEALDWVCAVLP